MAEFPKLSTGSLAQFPATRTKAFRTEIIRYVDGSDQRIALAGKPVVRWSVPLRRLNAAEAAAVRTFFLQQRGQAGTFSFTDPWTGALHPQCCFENDALSIQAAAEGDLRTVLVIRDLEN